MNRIKKQKCYQIAKVYRKDDPSIKKGRLREFFQCDFDIAGSYDYMVADAECLRILWEILSELDIGNFDIKVNDRRILDGIFQITGSPENKFQAVCSIIDRLDKIHWHEAKSLMIKNEIDEQTADEIGQFVQMKGGVSLIDKLLEDPRIQNNCLARSGLVDLKLLFYYLDLFGISDKVRVDLSLARGLTYYTSLIYEAVTTDPNNQVGSIAGGGRYDNLVQHFCPTHTSVPCVGFSVGIERIFAIIESRMSQKDESFNNGCQVYVCSITKECLSEKMKLLSLLWAAGIQAKMSHNSKTKLLVQLHECEDENIPIVLIVGPREIKDEMVIIREVQSRKEVKINRKNLIPEVLEKLKSFSD